MPKPKLPILLTRHDTGHGHMAEYDATSQTTAGVWYHVVINRDGVCSCTCPGFTNHYLHRASKAGETVTFHNSDYHCPHIRSVVESMWRTGAIKMQFVTPTGVLEVAA